MSLFDGQPLTAAETAAQDAAATDRAYAKLTEQAQRQRQMWAVQRVAFVDAATRLNAIVGDGGCIHTAQATEDGEIVIVWWHWEG